MSEEQGYQWTTEYDEPHNDHGSEDLDSGAETGPAEVSDTADRGIDDDFRAAIEARIKRRRRIAARKKRLRVVGVIVLIALVLTMCGGEIIKLKAENYALRKQQAELKAERDRLTKELEVVGDKEYIKDQARKQLRLLDPGEIMFVFDDGKSKSSDNDDKD